MTYHPREHLRTIGLWITGWTKLGTLKYKPRWNAWKFAPVYATTYLLGTLWGVAGVSSLSRIWYERSRVFLDTDGNLYEMDMETLHGKRVTVTTTDKVIEVGWRYPWSRRFTRALDWLVPGKHGAHTGPAYLWGSKSAWRE